MSMLRTTTVLLAATALVAAPAAALARGGGDDGGSSRDVRVAGSCTTSASSKLKLSSENGRIEVEFEVDQNRNGVPWRVVLKRNGATFAATTAVTRGPSGSFEVRRLTANGPGADRISATATRVGGSGTCTAQATFSS